MLLNNNHALLSIPLLSNSDSMNILVSEQLTRSLDNVHFCVCVCVAGTLDDDVSLSRYDTSTIGTSSTTSSTPTPPQPSHRRSLPHPPPHNAPVPTPRALPDPPSRDNISHHTSDLDEVDPYQPQMVAGDSSDNITTTKPFPIGVFLESSSPPPSPDPFSLNINFDNMTPIELPPPKPISRKSVFEEPDISNLDNLDHTASDRNSSPKAEFASLSDTQQNTAPFSQLESIRNPFLEDIDFPSKTDTIDHKDYVNSVSPALSDDSALPTTGTFSSIAEETLSSNSSYNAHNHSSHEKLSPKSSIGTDEVPPIINNDINTSKSVTSQDKRRRSSVPSFLNSDATAPTKPSSNSSMFEISRSSSQSGANAILSNSSTTNLQHCGLRNDSCGSVNDDSSPLVSESGGGVVVGGAAIGVRSVGMVRGGSVNEKRSSQTMEDEWERKLCGRRSSEYPPPSTTFLYVFFSLNVFSANIFYFCC